MAVRQFGNYGAFANDTNRGGGFFDWKKKGSAIVWIHMTAAPIISYRHNIPTLIPWEDRDTRKKEMRVWGRKYVCPEESGVLAEQHFYEDKKKGIRTTPPAWCGVCKMIEWARMEALAFERTRKKEVHRGIELTKRVFDFKGDRDAEHKIIRLGGMCNLFGWKDLKPSAQSAMKAANDPPIYKGGWDQNFMAKPEYGFFIVPDDDPDHGIRFSPESGGLGQAFQKKLKELMENGTDPSKTPIGLRWKYNDKAPSFNEIYTVSSYAEDDGRLKVPSKRIRQLIESDKLPPIPKDFTESFNQITMRMMLEQHCTLDVPKGDIPWDKFFPSKAAIQKRAKMEESSAPTPEVRSKKEEPEEEEFACDACEKPVKASEPKCPHCGHEFEVDAAEAAPKKTVKKVKKRSSASGGEKAAAKSEGTNGGGSRKLPPRTPDSAPAEDTPGGEEDDIPFVVDMTRTRGGV
jgi:hypothetical protein